MKSITRRLKRSVLFCPADRISAMSKAVTAYSNDVVVFDLEDAVSPEKKLFARENLLKFLTTCKDKQPNCEVIIRINCPQTTEWGADDLSKICANNSNYSILLPKVEDQLLVSNTYDILQSLDTMKSNKAISLWCMIETAKGIQNVDNIAAIPYVSTIVFGSNDLTKDINAKHVQNREPLLYSMSRCIIAAKASRKIVIDGVHINLSDEEGLIESCIQGRNLGFDGKSLIHPSQIDITNQYFSPSIDEINHAKKVIEAYNNAYAVGKGIVVVDNKLVEKLHVEQAELILKHADEIANMENMKNKHTAD